jgi:hypothetical protein
LETTRGLFCECLGMSLSDWQEPEVSSSHPGATGYPIGIGPPNKLLSKDKKKKQVSVDTPSGSTAVTPYPRLSSEDSISGNPSAIPSRTHTPAPAEEKFKIRLKTGLFDSLAKSSHVRKSPRVAGNDINYYEKAKMDLGLTKRSRSSTPGLRVGDRYSPNRDSSVAPDTPDRDPELDIKDDDDKEEQQRKKIKISSSYVCLLLPHPKRL